MIEETFSLGTEKVDSGSVKWPKNVGNFTSVLGFTVGHLHGQRMEWAGNVKPMVPHEEYKVILWLAQILI